jgi:hypothetical protein
MSTYDVLQPRLAFVKYVTVAGSSVLRNTWFVRLGSISLSAIKASS